jgi:hypothetical protein
MQDWLDVGGAWVNEDANFDNVGEAILSLFIASTTEGWLEIAFNGVDAVGIHKQPQVENNMFWLIFFVFYVILGNFFILNLLVCVVIDNFNIEKSMERGDAFLTEE